jgi:hypothetical protein
LWLPHRQANLSCHNHTPVDLFAVYILHKRINVLCRRSVVIWILFIDWLGTAMMVLDG